MGRVVAEMIGAKNFAIRDWFRDRRVSPETIFVAFAIVGLIASIVERVALISGLPLWLDETWTAVIAGQLTWHRFWREAWLDCNPPLYYLLESLWVSVAGTSNFALRLPSLVCVYLAGAVPLFLGVDGLSKFAAATWGLLLVFWWPGIAISLDARSYGFMFLLAVTQTIVFIRIQHGLDARRALTWACLSSTMILTHYYAAALILVQSLMILWKYRLQVFSFWYAAVPFVPTAMWGIYHLPRLLEYARPDVAWYETVNLYSAAQFAVFTFGPPGFAFVSLVAGVLVALYIAHRASRKPRDGEERPRDTALLAACVASATTFALLIVVGIFQASLTDRYLVPVVPGILLFLVALLQRHARPTIAMLVMVIVFLTGALTYQPLKERLWSRANYGYEEASDFIAQYKPTNLVFLWDHPATKILDRDSLDQIGGFFLRRSGIPVQVEVIYLDGSRDPNLVLTEAATGARPAILWLYNAARKSVADDYPPTLSSSPDWTCRELRSYNDDGDLTIGSIGCFPKKNAGTGK